jgi:hypothetical protein
MDGIGRQTGRSGFRPKVGRSSPRSTNSPSTCIPRRERNRNPDILNSRPETGARFTRRVPQKCGTSGLLGKICARKPRNLGLFAGDSDIAQLPRLRGWGGRIRTSVWRNQNPLPYRLATPQLPAKDPRVRGAADHNWRAPCPQPCRHAARQSLRSATSSIRCVMPLVRTRLARGRVGRMFSCKFRKFVRVQMPSAVSSASLSARSAYF